MDRERGARVAGWAGVAFVVLSSAIVLAAGWPPLGAPATEVVAFYREHRLAFLVCNWLAVVAIVPGVLQVAFLAAVLRRAEGEGGWLWLAALAAASIALATGGAALIVQQAVPFQLEPGQEAVAKGLSDVACAGLALFLPPLAAFVLATSWAVYATGALPRWFAHAGLPVAALSLVASAGAVWTTPGALAGGGLLSVAAAGAFFAWSLALAVIFLGPRFR